MHRGGGLFSVAGAVVENVSVGWIVPQQAGAGEGPEKQHLTLKGVGQCDHRRGRSHVADYSKNLVFLIELLHCFGSSSRLVTVVCRDEAELPAVHPAIGVGHVERRHDAPVHILAEFLGRTTQCCGNPKPNFTVGYPPKGAPLVLAGSVRATLAAPARLRTAPLLSPLQSLWLERVHYSPARYSL